jgi:hypothetical protein
MDGGGVDDKFAAIDRRFVGVGNRLDKVVTDLIRSMAG